MCLLKSKEGLSLTLVILNGTSKKEFIVGIERTCLVTTSCFGECLGCSLASYFVFDIAYPRQHYPFLLFIQHVLLLYIVLINIKLYYFSQTNYSVSVSH